MREMVGSAYYPRSNKRAEVGVKSAKGLIQDNPSPSGDLDTDKFARALLIHRNTPDPLTDVSPAQIVFGRSLRDHPLPCGTLHPRKGITGRQATTSIFRILEATHPRSGTSQACLHPL